MKRIFHFLLCLTLVFSLITPFHAYAEATWPDYVPIQAEGGIVIDADTGTVLYGKNIHTAYYPASITKIMTALVVIENCSLDEMVTFSHNAVYNVEAGSSSAGLDEGDVLSVRDCLYALLLKSANESANALAEHVAGSTEAFAEMMNAKAASLGCQDSHFANPSGLNNPDHYVSAYDMALIGRAALNNPTFLEIDSTLYYDLPVTKRNPEGGRIYPGHKMLKKNMPEYYEGCIGGKTGYTSLAGNTLVTFARRNGMTLVSVVLNGHQTQYTDTKALLDFGFQNFQTVSAGDYDTTYQSVTNDMTIAGLTTSELAGLMIDPDSKVTIPKASDFSSVTSQISYDLPADAPQGAIAQISYQWGQRKIGTAYLKLSLSPQAEDTAGADSSDMASGAPGSVLSGENDSNEDSSTADVESLTRASGNPEGGSVNSTSDSTSQTLPEVTLPDKTRDDSSPLATFHVPSIVWIVLAVLFVGGAIAAIAVVLHARHEQKEEEERILRKQKRLARLEASGISQEEFDLMLERKRSSYTTTKKGKRTLSRKRK